MSRSEFDLYTGTLIKDLVATVERVERAVELSAASKLDNGENISGATTTAATKEECDDDQTQRPKSSRNRFVWARLTGISLCFLSSMRN